MMESIWTFERIDNLGTKDRPVLKAGPFGSSVKKESYVGSGFKLYGQQEVLSGNIKARDYYIDRETFDRHKNCSVRPGDILITMMGTVGKTLLVPTDHEPGIINPRLMRISLDTKKVNPAFVKIYLDTPKLQTLFERRAHGGTMPGLNAEAIGSIKIPVPDIKTQLFAINAFDMWDTAIEKTEALIHAKQQQFGWLATKLIGEQAAHLSKLADHFGNSITVEKGKPLIEANAVQTGNIPVIAAGKTSPYSHDQSTHSIPCITISASGAYAGYVWFHDYPIWASDCNVLYSTDHSIEYLYFALKLKQSRIYAFQSGGGQPHVYARDLKNIAIPFPPLPEQQRIAHILNTAKQEIDLLIKMADQYRTQKRGLMQKLLSGEWRVKAVEEVEA